MNFCAQLGKVMKRLQAYGLTMERIKETSQEEVEQLIYGESCADFASITCEESHFSLSIL